jgi:hypothetical protein
MCLTSEGCMCIVASLKYSRIAKAGRSEDRRVWTLRRGAVHEVALRAPRGRSRGSPRSAAWRCHCAACRGAGKTLLWRVSPVTGVRGRSGRVPVRCLTTTQARVKRSKVMPGGLPRTGTPPAEAPSTVTVRQMSGHAEEWRRRAWEERTGDSDQARSRTLRGWAIRGRGGERTVLRRHEVQELRREIVAKSRHRTSERL